MGKKTTMEVDSGRPTFTSDFITSDIEQASLLGGPVLDNLVETVIALSAEIWADRRRARVIEKLLEEKGITEEMIESYRPSAEDEAAWDADRDRFIRATLEPLTRHAHLPLDASWRETE
jgi:hypothetical protein